MFGSNVLEVGIGLIFTFLTVSLISGQVTETIATMRNWRSGTLLESVKTLVNDPDFNGMARDLYNTALVHPRGDGTAATADDLSHAPSYIDPKHFAQALLNTVADGRMTVTDIKVAIGNVPNEQIRAMLTSLTTQAGDSVDALRNHIATWFDAGMARVSGDYKRRTQVWCFSIGFGIAALLNIDTLHIAAVLWHNPDLAKAVGSASEQTSREALSQLNALGFPIGWTDERIAIWSGLCLNWHGFWTCGGQVLGWVITAGSTLFGTSFWYDTLGNVLKLRGSGPAPAKAATTPAGA